MESIPGPHNHLKYGLWNTGIGRGGRGRGGRGGLRGGRWDREGGMTSLLEFRVQMFTICFQKSPKTTHSRSFRGVGGVCIFLELDRAIEIIFGKLLGEIEFEFLGNLKYLVEFEERARIRKKRLVEAEASPSIHALFHRSLVPPTALQRIRAGATASNYSIWRVRMDIIFNFYY